MVPAFAGLAPRTGTVREAPSSHYEEHYAPAHCPRGARGHRIPGQGLIGAFEQGSGKPFAGLKVDGGACRNDFLMQFQGTYWASR
jgi:glycerol kinase